MANRKAFVALAKAGTSPGNVSGEIDFKAPPPMSDVLLIVQDDDEEDGGSFLFRYYGNRFGGDTWHEDAKQAMEQAEHEYLLGHDKWAEIPSALIDHHASFEWLYKELKNNKKTNFLDRI